MGIDPLGGGLLVGGLPDQTEVYNIPSQYLPLRSSV